MMINDMSEEATKAFSNLMVKCVRFGFDTNDPLNPKPIALSLGGDAQCEWEKFYYRIAPRLHFTVKCNATRFSRSEVIVLRTALCVQIAKQISLGSNDGGIDAASVLAGIASTRPRSIGFFGETVLCDLTDGDKFVRHILDKTKRMGGTITAGVLAHCRQSFKNLDDARKLMVILERQGYGMTETSRSPSGKGREAFRFTLHPSSTREIADITENT